MSVTISKIHAGPARIYVGVTVAGSGAPPTYTTHTDGVPGTGTDVGATEGAASFVYQAVKQPITAEQSLGPVDVFTTEEKATLTFTCQEQTYITLQQAFDNVGKESISGGDAFWFGNGTTIIAPNTTCVFLSSRQRNAPTKFIITELYKVISMDGMQIAFDRKNRSLYKVMFTALADLTRTAGDQMGYYRFEK